MHVEWSVLRYFTHFPAGTAESAEGSILQNYSKLDDFLISGRPRRVGDFPTFHGLLEFWALHLVLARKPGS